MVRSSWACGRNPGSAGSVARRAASSFSIGRVWAAHQGAQHRHDVGVRRVQTVLESLALLHQLASRRLWAWSFSCAAMGREPGARLLRAAEVGDEGGGEPVGLVAAQAGLGVAGHGQGLEHADGVTGGVNVPGHGPAVGAGGFQAEVKRAGGGGPGQEPDVTRRRVGHGGGAGLRSEAAGVELVFGHVEAQDGFGRTHTINGLVGWLV